MSREAVAAEGWARSRVVALFAADADCRSDVAWRRANACAAAFPPTKSFPIAEQDWVRQTQAQFGPIEIATGFWIVPSWSAVPEPGALNLRLDPGLAFGTGSHPTTRLCLEWLREHLTGRRIGARLRLWLRHPRHRRRQARRPPRHGRRRRPAGGSGQRAQRAGKRRRRGFRRARCTAGGNATRSWSPISWPIR